MSSISPVLEVDPTFVTAQGSSFFIGDGEGGISSFSRTADCQSTEDLAGSYCYASEGATPPGVQALPAGRSAPSGEFGHLQVFRSKIFQYFLCFLGHIWVCVVLISFHIDYNIGIYLSPW